MGQVERSHTRYQRENETTSHASPLRNNEKVVLTLLALHRPQPFFDLFSLLAAPSEGGGLGDPGDSAMVWMSREKGGAGCPKVKKERMSEGDLARPSVLPSQNSKLASFGKTSQLDVHSSG